jgi:predicted Fe-S protein YdhL (DUF1289 family)
MGTVKIRWNSPDNITFWGAEDTEIERSEWEAMSEKAKNAVIEEIMWEHVDFYAADEEYDDIDADDIEGY